jgi:hypothetical protein
MGVDVYMDWDGFGKQESGNPNYDAQITGWKPKGKAGYLRISYSYINYKEATSPFYWDWENDIDFTLEVIEKFEKLVKEMSGESEQEKKEYMDFAKLGRRLNKEGKNPKVHISY